MLYCIWLSNGEEVNIINKYMSKLPNEIFLSTYPDLLCTNTSTGEQQKFHNANAFFYCLKAHNVHLK